jgi:hypothetical protein
LYGHAIYYVPLRLNQKGSDMYRERFVPSEEHRSFTFPPELYGQEVEIVAQRPVHSDSSSYVDELLSKPMEGEPIWKRYPNLNGGELAMKAHEEFLASMTPQERTAHKEYWDRRWAERDRRKKEFDFNMSIRDYREWRKEAYGYDPDYYKQFDGR